MNNVMEQDIKKVLISEEEIRECDAYAALFGVEMIPCIQTLAHLRTALRWPAMEQYRDNMDILLAEEEKTYELIDAMLAAVSRMYLGVHYPRDVFVGLLLGVGISWLCAKLWDRALGHSGLFAATFGLMSIFLFVARSHDFLQLYGLFGGFAAGCAYEERYVRFGMRDRASRKAARFVLGLCVIGLVYGLGKLLPDLLWLIPIRYFFVAFAGYGLVPMLFKKLGI